MAAGLGEQIEGRMTAFVVTSFGEKPWKQKRTSNKFIKTVKHRRERRRASSNPECPDQYRQYWGFEW
jgi:hypothetical protein